MEEKIKNFFKGLKPFQIMILSGAGLALVDVFLRNPAKDVSTAISEGACTFVFFNIMYLVSSLLRGLPKEQAFTGTLYSVINLFAGYVPATALILLMLGSLT